MKEKKVQSIETRFLCWVIRWVMVPFVEMRNTRRGLFCKELQNKNFSKSAHGLHQSQDERQFS